MESCPPAPCLSTPPSATRPPLVCTGGTLSRAQVVPPWSPRYVVQSFVALAFKPANIHLQWDLVCHRAHLPGFSQMMLCIGLAIGGVLLAKPTDKYGRKWNFLINIFLMSVFGIFSAFTDSFNWFSFHRFMVGVFTGVSGFYFI